MKVTKDGTTHLTAQQIQEIHRKIREESERNFDIVKGEFLSGELLRKINESGHCEYVFEKLGQTVLTTKRKCQREKGHKGAHMFGLWNSNIS